MLRVALDARCLQDHPLGGVGRSTKAVVEAVRGDVELLLLTDERRPPAPIDLPQRPLTCPVPTKAAWLQLAIPPALREFDGIFHCPWYGLPFRQPVPMVATIYDLTFEHGAVGFRWHQRLAFRAQARWAARTAAHVMTGSRAVRDELVSRYRLAPDRVTVQPTPLDSAVERVEVARIDALRSRLGVPGRYVVAVAGAQRRRIDLAISAWSRVLPRYPDMRLVVIGGVPPVPLPPGVLSAGVVDDGDWAAALQGAEALVYPTEFEGFGYPAAEAMALGTPVICGQVGSLPEVIGDAGCWFDTHDPESIADALVQLLSDAEYRADLAQRGLERTEQASDLAQLRVCVLDAYRAAAASDRHRRAR